MPICGNIAGIDGQGGDDVVPVLNLTLVAEVAAVDAVVVTIAMLMLITVALKGQYHDIISMITLQKKPGPYCKCKKNKHLTCIEFSYLNKMFRKI
jgi:hypothetical protein